VLFRHDLLEHHHSRQLEGGENRSQSGCSECPVATLRLRDGHPREHRAHRIGDLRAPRRALAFPRSLRRAHSCMLIDTVNLSALSPNRTLSLFLGGG
jgi:hypothetical protein